MLSVTIREKDGAERRLTYEKEEVTIGRAKGSDILLPKNNISKRHARLVDKDDKIVLVDLRSTNGTYVNGRRITAPEIVGPKDKIYIGDFVMLVESMAAAPAPVDPQEAETALDMSPESAGLEGPTEHVGGEVAASMEPLPGEPNVFDAEPFPEPGPSPGPEEEIEFVIEDEPQPEPEPAIDPQASLTVMEDEDDEVFEATQALDLADIEAAVDLEEGPGEETLPEEDAAEVKIREPEPEPEPEEEILLDDSEPEAAPEPEPEPAPEPEAAPAADPAPRTMSYEEVGSDSLAALLADPEIEQVMVNGVGSAVVVRNGRSHALAEVMGSAEAIGGLVQHVLDELGYDPEAAPPVIDAVLPGGVSVNIVQPPLAPAGPVIVLRRRRALTVTVHALIESGAMTQDMATWLAEAVTGRKNVTVIARSSWARTTIANALAYFLPAHERIAVISDAYELDLPQGNVVHLDKNALLDEGEDFVELLPQLLADRVVIDPVSSEDVLGFVSLALGGTSGVIATAAGDSVNGVLRRLALQIELGIGARLEDRASAMVAEAVNVAVLVHGGPEDLRITEVVEIESGLAGGFRTTEIFGR